MQETKMTVDDAIINLAASVVDRTRELITDGWIKGHMSTSVDGAQTAFCIHGALNLALEEVFGAYQRGSDVEVLAVAFIVDEAKNQYGFKGSWQHGGIPAASFNDSPATKHEDVLNVLGAASKRLWSIGMDWESGLSMDPSNWVPSKWAEADVQAPEAQQFLHASLA